MSAEDAGFGYHGHHLSGTTISPGNASPKHNTPFSAFCTLRYPQMPSYDTQHDVFGSSQFLSPSTSSPRKSPQRQSINNRRSTVSLRGSSSLAHALDQDDHDDDSTSAGAPNGRQAHSLAHELAVALMPEPSAGSKLLAEEFGIEYDEGAEGIDEPDHPNHHQPRENGLSTSDAPPTSFADEMGAAQPIDSLYHDAPPADTIDPQPDFDPVFGSPSAEYRRQKKPRKPEQDAMDILAQDLESTDNFLAHLRRLDMDPGATTAHQPPALERIASEMIRRINETARDREGQVRELLECEREFRKIAGEVGGSDVLSRLDELEDLDSDVPPEAKSPTDAVHHHSQSRHLDVIVDDEPASSHRRQHSSTAHDWELDPDRHRLGDDDEDEEDDVSIAASSPVKDSFPPPPPINGPATPAKTIPQLANLRSFTTSLVSSLTTISEQAQVNGAATTEAGRKIRALKNKMGGWRTDWDSAERSRLRIDRWEAGIIDGESLDNSLPSTPRSPGSTPAMKRIDGRRVVAEHLQAFELALAEAALKTQAIMAR